MKALHVVVVCLTLAMVGGALTLMHASPGHIIIEDAWADLTKQVRHPVDQTTLDETHALVGKPAPALVLTSTSGKTFNLRDKVKISPVVLVKTLPDCPCSIESQPYFNQIALNYADQVQFVGVAYSDRQTAERYRFDFSVPYPMLVADATQVFRDFETPRSVYVTIVDTQGVVTHRWPGYSKQMLFELNNAIAQLANTEVLPFDATMAPDELTSGCSFFGKD